MITLEQPVAFLTTILNTFPRFFWGNYNNDKEAWIGIKSMAQVRFEYNESASLHLYMDNEHVVSFTYEPDSETCKMIEKLVKEVSNYFSVPKNSSYQNFYSAALLKQSEQIIRYYFKEDVKDGEQ